MSKRQFALICASIVVLVVLAWSEPPAAAVAVENTCVNAQAQGCTPSAPTVNVFSGFFLGSGVVLIVAVWIYFFFAILRTARKVRTNVHSQASSGFEGELAKEVAAIAFAAGAGLMETGDDDEEQTNSNKLHPEA